MKRFGLRGLATFTIGALAFMGLGSSGASAHMATSSFAGTYTLHMTVPPMATVKETMLLNADGTVTIVGKNDTLTDWYDLGGGKVIIEFTENGGVNYTLEGHQTLRGVTSKRKPGTVSVLSGLVFGTFYAIKTA